MPAVITAENGVISVKAFCLPIAACLARRVLQLSSYWQPGEYER